MKKKVGTVLEEAILAEAKARAARERRPVADLFQEAVVLYLRSGGKHGDAERACELFCSHTRQLELHEINELLDEDVLMT